MSKEVVNRVCMFGQSEGDDQFRELETRLEVDE